MNYTIRPNHLGIYFVDFRDPVTGKRIRKSLKTRKQREANTLAPRVIEKYFNPSILFEEYAAIFFTDQCPWTQRRNAVKKPLDDQTLKKYRFYLTNYIIPYFAGMDVAKITTKQVHNFALTLKYDGTTKNNILALVKHIIDEAVLDEIRSSSIQLMRFPKTVSSQAALSQDTINALWPDDLEKMLAVWNNPKMRDKNAPLMYATMCAVMLSGGLRSGEVRALGVEHVQLFDTHGRIFIERALTGSGSIGRLKGDKRINADSHFGNNKARVAIIPEKTVRLLKSWLEVRPESSFLFVEAGTPITKDRLTQRLRRIVTENAIKERVTPHTFRFTFKSRTRALIDEMTGQLLMGHSDTGMSDWYDRPVLEERAVQFEQLGIPEKIQGVWK